MEKLRCHRCKSPDLVLHETRHEHAEIVGGLVINEEGRIEGHGDAWFTPGEIQPQLTRIECNGCGHEWRPRRLFAGIKDGTDA
jgi:hypothetical protein